MSLYDDDDIIETANPTGWAKPTIKPAAPFAAPQATAASPGISPAVAGLNRPRPLNAAPKSLPPVINLQKPKRPSSASPFPASPATGRALIGAGKSDYDDVPPPTKTFSYGGSGDKYSDSSRLPLKDPNWTPVNEYDPLWPNDYYKVAAEIKDAKRKQRAAERAAEEEESKRRKFSDGGGGGERDKGGRDREKASGFGMRPKGFGDDDYSDEEDENSPRGGGRSRGGAGGGGGSGGGSGGAAIAPPPSLTASSSPPRSIAGPQIPSSMQKAAGKGLGFAAKLMAKFGYKVSCIDGSVVDLLSSMLTRYSLRRVKVSAETGRECRRL